jgi:hypothetical protein
MQVFDQKSLNNYKLQAENMYFHEHKILIARQCRELEHQKQFIFTNYVSKINFQIQESQHALLLTRMLWKHFTSHTDFFFEVILNANLTDQVDRTRALLTPFQINHVNIKRKSQ